MVLGGVAAGDTACGFANTALQLAHHSVQDIINLQFQMAEEIGKEKRVIELPEVDDILKAQVEEKVSASISDILHSKYDRDDRKKKQSIQRRTSHR